MPTTTIPRPKAERGNASAKLARRFRRRRLQTAKPPKDKYLSGCSPEGSYTEDASQEHHTPHHHSGPPPQPGHPSTDPHDFDDEFDDDDPLPVIGHCKALYSFDGKVKYEDHFSHFWDQIMSRACAFNVHPSWFGRRVFSCSFFFPFRSE